MDTDNEKQAGWPVAVFLDTNVLDQLPESLNSGELASLIDRVRYVYVADVAAREWITHRIEKAIDSLESAWKVASHLKQYQESTIEISIDPKDLIRRVKSDCVNRLRRSGLRVLRPPSVTLRSITHRATLKFPPFREKGRGFKDELIFQTMLERVCRYEYSTLILISQDSDFSHNLIKESFADKDVNFQLAKTISAADQLIEKILDKEVKARIARDEAFVKCLAEKKWEEIKKKIESETMSEGLPEFIIGSLDKGNPTSTILERLVKVEPVAIKSTRVGRRHPATGRDLITVSVECRIEAEARVTNVLGRLVNSRLTMQGKKPLDAFTVPPLQTITFERNLSVECTAIHSEDGTWSDLQIVKDKAEYGRMLLEILDSDE